MNVINYLILQELKKVMNCPFVTF